jgi:hypothetical protein
MPISQNIRRRSSEEAEVSTGSYKQKTELGCYGSLLLLIVAVAVASMPSGVSSFTIQYRSCRTTSVAPLRAVLNGDDEITQGVLRARALLEKTKAKLAAQAASKAMSEENSDGADGNDGKTQAVPFFAASQPATAAGAGAGAVDNTQRRDQVTKYRDEATGLITTDGEKMAAMSESEVWETRSLLDMNDDVPDKSTASKRLADRDVAASIFNMRRHLQVNDYRKIFDTKNRFIGEDN